MIASTEAAASPYDAERVARLANEEVAGMLVSAVRSNAERYFPDVAGGSWRIACKPWGGQETARTFRVDLTGKDSGRHEILYVKLCPIFASVNPSRLEYETLKLLYEAMPKKTKRCFVSRPVDFYPELNAYAMESVGTENLKPYLLKSNSRGASEASLAGLYDIMAGCAEWLRAFHDLTKSGKIVTFDATAFYNAFTEDFDYRQLRSFRFRREVLDKLDRILEKLGDLSGKFTLPCAKWHWDYTPGHVFLDHDRISVIDILGADDIPIYEDIGRFLASLSTINNLPWHPFFDHERARGRLNDIFLNEYSSGISVPAFKLFAAIYKLKYLVHWFCGQHFRVSTKTRPFVGNLFANYRLVGLYENQLAGLCDDIIARMAIAR
jgi:hypothetical protein